MTKHGHCAGGSCNIEQRADGRPAPRAAALPGVTENKPLHLLEQSCALAALHEHVVASAWWRDMYSLCPSLC